MRPRGRLSGESISITSPSGTLSPKSPLSPEPKNKFICGNFSPVHTRRRTQSEDVPKVLPDFAEFEISQKCPNLSAKLEMEVHDVEAELLDLLQIESELNMFLTHCIDHQKKIIGEIHFMETGDYRSEDISKRLMPSYELRSLEDIPPSTSAEADEEVPVNDGAVNEEDDYESSCPTVNMPGKFWKFIKEYQGPIDESFLYRYYTRVLSPSVTDGVTRLGENVENGVMTARTPDRKHDGSCMTSPICGKLLKRQVSSGRRFGRPPKAARTANDNIDSLLAETIQAWSTEEKLNSLWLQNGLSESHECNGVEAFINGCNGVGDEPDEKFDRKNLGCEDKFADRFDKSYLGIEYRNLKDTVISVINASQNDFAEDVEKKSLKKESVDQGNKDVNGTNGSRVVAHFEAFKKTLMNFVKGAIENSLVADSKPIDSNKDMTFTSANGNRGCVIPCKPEDLEMGEVKSEPVEIGQDLDQVSAALKKAEEDLQDRNEACRYLVITIWHRMLAEYLRNKIESNLTEATKELNAVREKYFRDYPPKKPANDKERDECAAALQKYNTVLKAYYEK